MPKKLWFKKVKRLFLPHFLRHEAPLQDTGAACNIAKEVNSKHALSGGDEGTGNAVVISLNPVIQGFCLSPEGLRYIFVLLKFFLIIIIIIIIIINNNIYASVQSVVCCSHQSDSLGYVSRTNQIAALGYVSRTNQSVIFVLWFERCSNFNKVMGDSERAVRQMESSFRMRNIGFSVFLTCILPHFMRNAILLNR